MQVLSTFLDSNIGRLGDVSSKTLEDWLDEGEMRNTGTRRLHAAAMLDRGKSCSGEGGLTQRPGATVEVGAQRDPVTEAEEAEHGEAAHNH